MQRFPINSTTIYLININVFQFVWQRNVEFTIHSTYRSLNL